MVERFLGITRKSKEAMRISELLQLIYRSQLRDGKPVTVVLPDERYHVLMADWLAGKI